MDKFFHFTGRMDRRSPRNTGDPNSPWLRENLLTRNLRNKKMRGTERFNETSIDSTFRWAERYYTSEAGQDSPKTFAYAENGKLYRLDYDNGSLTEAKSGLNLNAYPRSWFYKWGEQTLMYLVDGKSLYEYDGNNSNNFTVVGVNAEPIDVIEHKDRLCLLTKNSVLISKNLEPTNFTDASDAIEIIIGSGKGTNVRFGKILDLDTLYILTTEGIFGLYGDTISAVASTFEVRLVDERKILAAGSACDVERGILFVAEDYELWDFNGQASQMISYPEKLSDFINPQYTESMCSIYDPVAKYYKLSFTDLGTNLTYNTREVWYDTVEKKIDFVVGRNVSCYMQTDTTKEPVHRMVGRSDGGYIMWADRGRNYDGEGIVIKFRSRGIRLAPGRNLRYEAFYPVIEPKGQRNCMFRYLMDTRDSEYTDSNSNWEQDLSGEAKALGFIRIANQHVATDRVKPKIKWSKGESVTFEIYNAEKDLEFSFLGIGIDVIDKWKKKSKTIGK